MVTRVETIVVGGGAMGAATAWQLARRGQEVALLERWEPGHRMGASHGASRNFNVAYSDPTYVQMLVEALPLWRELEAESGTSLLDLVGVANHGPRGFDDVQAALAEAGIPAEFLSVDEAGERWPGIRFDTRVLFNERGRTGERGCHGAGAARDRDGRGRRRAPPNPRHAHRRARRRTRARGIRHRCRRHRGVRGPHRRGHARRVDHEAPQRA